MLFPVDVVFAAPRKGYEAKLLNTNLQYTLTPGETKTIGITYKNIGKTVWKNKGDGYVSLYTFESKYRKSDFATKDWLDATHPVRLKEKSVAPGKMGHFDLTLKAPLKTGTYTETFSLVSEDTTWISSGVIAFIFSVKEPKKITTPISKATNGLSGMILLRSAKQITADAGEQISYKVGIKNTGTVGWTKREIQSSDYVIASANTQTPIQIALKTDGEVKPGAIDFLSFDFIAPTKKGTYTVSYRFAANDVVLPDVLIDIPVEVTNDAEDVLESPLAVDPSQINELNIITEPLVRVGVLIVDEETQNQVKISCNTDWKLFDGNGALLSEQVADSAVTAFYKNKRYYFNRNQGLEQSSFYLRFVPNTTDGICKIENFDKRVTRHAGFAENSFRNILELRYNSAKDRTWLINELPMEQYLYGLGETSEASPYEFKKALITIARTFALYQWERATKHASEYFHMNAYADDQVYRGYEYEMNNSSIRKAAEETRGITVNYEGRTAITPYFSRSDGRTRDWNEVWRGDVPWIKSVPTPCDAANHRKLWGHGIGMSATEALCMANDGKKWDEIVHYFYQNIDLKKRWN